MDDIQKKIVELSPWHLNVDVTEDISTAYSQQVPNDLLPSHEYPVSFINPKMGFITTLKKIYPQGLAGKRFLDCACNCGGYSFWVKELGATETFGFDVREHWINQANFLKEHRIWPSDGMRFEVCDLYNLPGLELSPFDITIFKGLFYHLPDPITGLKFASDLTKEILFLDTATINIIDPEPLKGCLVASFESVESYMSGVYGLNWFPSGPIVLEHILRWLGFKEIKVLRYQKTTSLDNTKGRVSMVASKIAGLLTAFE